MKEYLFQQYDTLSNGWGTIDTTGNNTTNQNADGTARSGIIDLPVNADLTSRRIYCYLFARIVADAFAYFEARVQLLSGSEVMVNLPLIFSYKNTAVLGNRFQIGAFTWDASGSATPILLPETIPLKVGSVFGQPVNPPADEPTGLIYLHPFPVRYPISKIRVDIVRWTNCNVNGNGRVVVVSKAD